MNITYDEYIATWQAPEAKESLNEKISEDAQKRYELRMNGAGSNLESRNQLAQLSPEKFRSLRVYQMVQLYEAYRIAYTKDVRPLLGIDTQTTDIDKVRRVVGDKHGYIYNDDILALDSDTIVAINYIAEMRGASHDFVDGHQWQKSMTPYNLEKVVDEMITCKNILAENLNLNYKDVEGAKIYRETDFTKRAIGKAQYKSDNQFESYLSPEKVGKNCFGIKDYELSWQKLMENKNKLWAKTGGKLFKFLDRKINPTAERNNMDRLGNKTVEVPDEYTGGER